MDANHQDTATNNLVTTENKLWLPPSFNNNDKVPIANGQVSEQKRRIIQKSLPSKGIWDWSQLLIPAIGAFVIPISIISLFISVSQFNEQKRINAQQALNQQQQATLDAYLNHMTDFLFIDKLGISKSGDEVRNVARAQTLAALQNLNSNRKGILLRFLYQSGLIMISGPGDKVQNPIIELSGADLSGADLHGVDLRDANLDDTNLQDANLYYANLSYTYLFGAFLRGANLNHAYVTQGQLQQAGSLKGAIMPNGSVHP